ncbi:MAG: hypothetical protein V1898_00670 [Patescibacteria group bacterium]
MAHKIERETAANERWSALDFLNRIRKAAEQQTNGTVEYKNLPKAIQLDIEVRNLLAEIQTMCISDEKEGKFTIMYDPSRRGLILPGMDMVDFSGEAQKHGQAVTNSVRGPLRIALPPVEGQRIVAPLNQHLFTAADKIKAANNPFYAFHYGPEGAVIQQAFVHPVMTAHTHPCNTPFSPYDIGEMLFDKTSKAHVLLDSKQVYSLFVPSYDTPRTGNEQEILKLIDVWMMLVHDKYNSLYASGMASEQASFAAQDELVQSLAKQYKAGYYRGYEGALRRVV